MKRGSSPTFSTIAFAVGLYCGYFAAGKQINSPSSSKQLSVKQAQVAFTPGQNCTALITQAIDEAKHNIFVQAYGFTCPHIAQALYKAAERGVKVRILLDKSNKTNKMPALATVRKHRDITVAIDPVPGIAHNKVMILDDTVITGSFNFTNSAQKRNAENIIKIRDPEIAQVYLNNWYKRQASSQKLQMTLTDSTEPKNSKTGKPYYRYGH